MNADVTPMNADNAKSGMSDGEMYGAGQRFILGLQSMIPSAFIGVTSAFIGVSKDVRPHHSPPFSQ